MIYTFGDYVRHSRFRLGLNLTECAKLVGISGVELCRIENQQSFPTPKTYAKLIIKLEMDDERAYELYQTSKEKLWKINN